ncbi:MAG: hypothetical protein JWM27_3734 [Gemmatimonadetes bacterium]|nr:hypothetical protein [Gemmatimonadota bacterium]
MMHVRPALAAFALAALLAACDAGRSPTDPGFRNSKAAPGDRAGSGVTMHADNGGTYGSGYNLDPCLANTGTSRDCASFDNGGTYGSGYDLAPCVSNTGSAGSGYNAPGMCPPPESTGFGGSGYLRTPTRGGHAPIAPATKAAAKGPHADDTTPPPCIPPEENGGTYGSGYNYCPHP